MKLETIKILVQYKKGGFSETGKLEFKEEIKNALAVSVNMDAEKIAHDFSIKAIAQKGGKPLNFEEYKSYEGRAIKIRRKKGNKFVTLIEGFIEKAVLDSGENGSNIILAGRDYASIIADSCPRIDLQGNGTEFKKQPRIALLIDILISKITNFPFIRKTQDNKNIDFFRGGGRINLQLKDENGKVKERRIVFPKTQTILNTLLPYIRKIGFIVSREDNGAINLIRLTKQTNQKIYYLNNPTSFSVEQDNTNIYSDYTLSYIKTSNDGQVKDIESVLRYGLSSTGEKAIFNNQIKDILGDIRKVKNFESSKKLTLTEAKNILKQNINTDLAKALKITVSTNINEDEFNILPLSLVSINNDFFNNSTDKQKNIFLCKSCEYTFDALGQNATFTLVDRNAYRSE